MNGRPKRPSFRPKIATGRSLAKSKSKSRKPSEYDYGNNWQQLSAFVRERDGYRCQVNKLDQRYRCNGYYPPPFSNLLHTHHIVPLSKGGQNHVKNLITLCNECHGKIHDKYLGKITDKQKRAVNRRQV